MYNNNRNLPGGGKPTEERRREYGPARAVGQTQLAFHEAKEREKAEEERKKALPTERKEIWKRRKKKGVRPSGGIEVELYRNAKGKFSKPPSLRQITDHYNLKTGREIPQPTRRTA